MYESYDTILYFYSQLNHIIILICVIYKPSYNYLVFSQFQGLLFSGNSTTTGVINVPTVQDDYLNACKHNIRLIVMS